MKEFLMVCYVAADFVSKKGDKFRVVPDQIGLFISTPEWVKETLLFRLLQADGSIKIGETKEEVKKIENDPLEGIGADGKASDEEVVEPEPVIKTRNRGRKKDDAE